MSFSVFCTILLLALICHAAVLPDIPQRPVIGVYTQEDEYDEPSTNTTLITYISAAYVKYVEMAGAQVVPIFAFSNQSSLLSLLGKVNGVLFTGGAGETEIHINNTWTKNADFILRYAVGENRKGNPFPIWGTCLGLQLLSYLTSGYDQNILQPIRDQERVFNTLRFQPTNSYLYDDLTSTLRTKLSKGQGILYFNHEYGLTAERFRANSQLSGFWKATSLTTSTSQDEFVSTLQARDYPIFAVQFHAEKNLYEWKVYADRTTEGAVIAQILANKFVERARQSQNRFISPAQLAKLSIYNYPTSPTSMSFMRIYMFKEPRPNQNVVIM